MAAKWLLWLYLFWDQNITALPTKCFCSYFNLKEIWWFNLNLKVFSPKNLTAHVLQPTTFKFWWTHQEPRKWFERNEKGKKDDGNAKSGDSGKKWKKRKLSLGRTLLGFKRANWFIMRYFDWDADKYVMSLVLLWLVDSWGRGPAYSIQTASSVKLHRLFPVVWSGLYPVLGNMWERTTWLRVYLCHHKCYQDRHNSQWTGYGRLR